jgi:hypothetical protein
MAAIAPARPLPPIGTTLLCLERGSTSAYPVIVERHQGRYFIAGAHRFHVYDDWKVGTTRHTWRKPAAMVWIASPEEQVLAAAEGRCLMAVTQSMDGPIDLSPTVSMAEVQWLPPAAPPGPPEPTEAW